MCPIFTTLLLLAVLAALAYIFLVWNFSYWQKRGIKTVKSWPFVGSFPSMFTQKRHVVYDIDEMYRKYKSTEHIVGVINSRMPQLLITNPEYAHKVFVNDFRSFHDNEFAKFTDKKVDRIFANNPFVLTGEEWKERRAEITPGFTANRVNAVYPVTQSVCAQLVDYIKRQVKMAPACGINAKEICLCYTTEVVADCVLGISSQSFTDKPTPMVKMTKRVFEQSYGFILYSSLVNLWPTIRKFYTVPMFAKEVETFFYDLMETCIKMRRKSGQSDRVDFLNYILQLQDKKQLDLAELTSHTMTFLTDGFETTALVISHTLLLLGRFPATQQLLREEVGEGPLSFEKISDLPYLDACIHESLRIFSPLLVARKVVTEPYDFVNKDGVSVSLVPDDVVMIPVHSIQHDEEFYEQPEDFKPERFLEANGSVRDYRERGLYYGFGDGPRVCLGMRFALTQVKAALADIVRHFDIKVNARTRKDNRLDDTFFMATLKGGIWLDFEPRA